MAAGKEAVGVLWSPGELARSGSFSRHFSQLPGSTASPCLPRKLREARGRRRMDAPVGVYRGLAREGCLEQRTLRIQKLPIWEPATLTKKEPGSGWALHTAPGKGRPRAHRAGRGCLLPQTCSARGPGRHAKERGSRKHCPYRATAAPQHPGKRLQGAFSSPTCWQALALKVPGDVIPLPTSGYRR